MYNKYYHFFYFFLIEHPINFSLQLENAAARNVFILSVNEGVVPGPTGSRKGEKIIDVCFVPKYLINLNNLLLAFKSIYFFFQRITMV